MYLEQLTSLVTDTHRVGLMRVDGALILETKRHTKHEGAGYRGSKRFETVEIRLNAVQARLLKQALCQYVQMLEEMESTTD